MRKKINPLFKLASPFFDQKYISKIVYTDPKLIAKQIRTPSTTVAESA